MDKILAVFLILLILTIFAVGLSSPNDCPVKCEVLFDPVCGSNRQTYKTTCHLKRYNCFEKLREKVIVVHKGECLAKEDDETEPHKEESRSPSFSLFFVHSIPWRECPPTFFGDVMDETHLEEDITSFSWSSILLPGNREE